MPQPLIGHQQQTSTVGLELNPQPSRAHDRQVVLRRRSSGYIAALGRLDVHGARQVDVSDVHAAILAEFPLDAAIPLGYVTKCYLGAPYVVHILDLVGNIVEHYRSGETLPALFERARKLALHPDYLAVEVYPDGMVTVRSDGTTGDVAG